MSASQVMILNYLLLNNIHMDNTINHKKQNVEKYNHKYSNNNIVSFKNINQKMRKFHNIKQPGFDVQRVGHK